MCQLCTLTIISFFKRENEERKKFVHTLCIMCVCILRFLFLCFDDMKQDHKKEMKMNYNLNNCTN